MKAEYHLCIKRSSKCKCKFPINVTPLNTVVLCYSNPHLACSSEEK